jgi:hypothetical protein
MKRLEAPSTTEAGNIYAQVKKQFIKDYFPGAGKSAKRAADEEIFTEEEAALPVQCGYTFPVIRLSERFGGGTGDGALLNTWDSPQWFDITDLEFFLLSDQEAEDFAAATEAGLFADNPTETLETCLERSRTLFGKPKTQTFALDHTKSFELANKAYYAIEAALGLLEQEASAHPDPNVRGNLSMAGRKLAEDLEELHLMVGDDE